MTKRVRCVEPKWAIEEWSPAVSAYAKALAFVRDCCGAVQKSLIPSHTMVLTLAEALSGEVNRADLNKDLERWFWASCFSQTLAQGANTQVVSDTRALRAWKATPAAVPDVVKNFKPDLEALQDARRRNEILVRAIACRLIKVGVKDWTSATQPLSGPKDPIELHHIFAEKYLANMGTDEPDIEANLTPILASTNQSLRNEPPNTVTVRTDIVRSSVEEHRVDWDLFSAAKWNEFLEDRAKTLATLMAEAVGR